ncbi:hypothetical protein [Streptosporangium minutum]|nr:hypothetical protein [Streptosporangium minutum]
MSEITLNYAGPADLATRFGGDPEADLCPEELRPLHADWDESHRRAAV